MYCKLQALENESLDEDDNQTMVDKKKKIKDLNRQMNKKLLKTKAFKRQSQIVRDKSRKKGRNSKKRK